MKPPPSAETRYSRDGYTVIVTYRLDPSRPVSNASLEFTIFGPDGAYLGGVRLLYTNLEQDDTVDEWVHEQGRRLIAQRLDMEWDFGLTVEQYAIDPTAFPWHPV